jgi:hypothetical protein
MALQLTFSNIVQLFSVFAPLFLGTFLVLVSVFNQNIKGLIYLGGVLIASTLGDPKESDDEASTVTVEPVERVSGS